MVSVVVDFWDESSAPCHLTAKVMKQLATDFAGKLRVARIDMMVVLERVKYEVEFFRAVGGSKSPDGILVIGGSK